MKPTIAVLLSVYKNDRLGWFREALDSILCQTYGREYIHIYLGIDGPIEVEIRDYIKDNKKLFFKVIESEEKIGKPRIINRLIECLDEEEFVFKMDADDISFEGRFEKQVQFLQQNKDIDIVGTSIMEIDGNGKEMSCRLYPQNPYSVRDYICKASPVAHPSVCFRRSVFNIVSGYPDGYVYNEDLALWFLCLRKGLVISNMETPLLYYRVTDSFYKRRREGAFSEFAIYMRGIWSLKGLSVKLFFPFIRLVFRALPVTFVRSIYRSNLRSKLN